MNIFDLEQEIMKTWHVVDDIYLLYENIMEKGMTDDDMANAFLGLKTLYNMRFEKLFDTFEEVCKQYHEFRKVKEEWERTSALSQEISM